MKVLCNHINGTVIDPCPKESNIDQYTNSTPDDGLQFLMEIKLEFSKRVLYIDIVYCL